MVEIHTRAIIKEEVVIMYKVLLNSVEKVKDFVNITSKFEFDAFLKSGRYVIDAKSIMGVFSINLMYPIDLFIEFKDTYDEAQVAEYLKLIEQFICE